MYKISVVFLLFVGISFSAESQEKTSISPIATNGWATNLSMRLYFKKNALTTFKNNQYAAYYNADQFVVLAERKLNSQNWEVMQKPCKGDKTATHKSISIIVDGEGFLHLAWGQHNNNLNYAKSVKSESLVTGKRKP
ncbi:BNR-4 repeat-containing protein [Pedobacter alpinus]|uniref:BNR-4 repeat-containing protein n=1 Tax=Pedobacter alpinus TaxID=1590643 RepID=A0ABW5TQ99_9SPHI